MHLRGGERAGHAPQQRRGVAGDLRVDGERTGALAQPRADELGVVVAGHEDRLAPGAEARADRPQHGLGDLHRAARAALEQLDDVAEEHEPVDAVERAQERVERGVDAQHVAAQARAEVQVGDDERAHARVRSVGQAQLVERAVQLGRVAVDPVGARADELVGRRSRPTAARC